MWHRFTPRGVPCHWWRCADGEDSVAETAAISQCAREISVKDQLGQLSDFTWNLLYVGIWAIFETSNTVWRETAFVPNHTEWHPGVWGGRAQDYETTTGVAVRNSCCNLWTGRRPTHSWNLCSTYPLPYFVVSRKRSLRAERIRTRRLLARQYTETMVVYQTGNTHPVSS